MQLFRIFKASYLDISMTENKPYII